MSDQSDASADPRSTPLLIRVATKSPDEDEANAAVQALRTRGDQEVLETASRLCVSNSPRERVVGAEVLGQLGGPCGTVFPEARYAVLEQLVRTENRDDDVLAAACLALGQLHDPRVCEPLARLRVHANPDVRFSVACGLLGYVEPSAVNALLELSIDADDEVRDWATFGIGSQIDLDTPEVRDALFARLEDANPDVQSEALVGLARRKDARALPIIAEHLQSSDLQLLDLDAAARFADPSLLPLLEQIELDPSDEEAAKCLADAIQASGGLLKSHSPTTNATGLQEKPTH